MKPNIRGFNRSQMRPGLFGWTAILSGQDRSQTVEYRMPLRKNWLIRMTKHPQSTIIQSRSGFIHIVRPKNSDPQNRSSRTKWFNPVVAFAGALVSVGAFLWIGTMSQTTPAQEETQMSDTQPAVKDLVQPSQCSNSEVVSMSNVESALSGLPSKLKILDRSKSIELGGYRLTSLTIECQSQRFKVKVTEAKFKSTWTLKKTARLEN